MNNDDSNHASTAQLDRFHAAMKAANMVALWEWNDARSNQPTQSEAPFHWRWQDVEPIFDQAVAATSMAATERRVVQLKHPAFPADYIAVTSNINCGFQILTPGETARPHRHNINALRFVVEGEGASTIVNGKTCPMEVGDLIITPGMAWHQHVHNGKKGRVVWMDALDSPLVRHLRCINFQPGPVVDLPPIPSDSAFADALYMPAGMNPMRHSPVFRYPGEDARAALATMPAAADGSRTLRYTNPTTGGAVMSLMDCYQIALAHNTETRPYRTTSNAACLVLEGEGVSSVGTETIRWAKNDVFTLPAWQWIVHKAEAPNVRLFQITDREVLRRLELLRDEVGV